MGEVYKASGTPSYMTVGNFDNDKNLDIAVSFNGVRVNFIRLFHGNGDGTFKPPVKVLGGKQSAFITQHDINNDGREDLITSSTMNDVIKIFLNNGGNGFISLEDAAARRGVSKRRITQQVSEGGWGIRKVDRNHYILYEDEKKTFNPQGEKEIFSNNGNLVRGEVENGAKVHTRAHVCAHNTLIG